MISADRRIRSNRPEREAWRRRRLIMFFPSAQWRRLRNVEIAWRLLRWWPRIEKQARLVVPPEAFELPHRPTARLARIVAGEPQKPRGYPGFRALDAAHACASVLLESFRSFL